MKMVVNASVHPDTPDWLYQAEDGHYFIEQMRNRQGCFAHRHPVSDSVANRIIEADLQTAWQIMEAYVANDL